MFFKARMLLNLLQLSSTTKPGWTFWQLLVREREHFADQILTLNNISLTFKFVFNGKSPISKSPYNIKVFL